VGARSLHATPRTGTRESSFAGLTIRNGERTAGALNDPDGPRDRLDRSGAVRVVRGLRARVGGMLPAGVGHTGIAARRARLRSHTWQGRTKPPEPARPLFSARMSDCARSRFRYRSAAQCHAPWNRPGEFMCPLGRVESLENTGENAYASTRAGAIYHNRNTIQLLFRLYIRVIRAVQNSKKTTENPRFAQSSSSTNSKIWYELAQGPLDQSWSKTSEHV
jgi:hypothetical protein